MKSTGIVRKVDELGRIVLPIELRRTMDIAEKDAIEIYVDGPSIILRKYEPTCIFCGDAKNITNYRGKNICPSCLKELKKLYDSVKSFRRIAQRELVISVLKRKKKPRREQHPVRGAAPFMQKNDKRGFYVCKARS